MEGKKIIFENNICDVDGKLSNAHVDYTDSIIEINLPDESFVKFTKSELEAIIVLMNGQTHKE